MSYRNKTYVIFDGDEDIWAYGFMKGWIKSEHIDFNFFDAHDLRPLTATASDETIFKRLRDRFTNAKQAILLLGEKTKNLRKFVPWEIELVKKLELPLVVSNLNDHRSVDYQRCPVSLQNYPAVHIGFRAKIIQYALDNYVDEFPRLLASAAEGPRIYSEEHYKKLGL
jgi:hypothetical protein